MRLGIGILSAVLALCLAHGAAIAAEVFTVQATYNLVTPSADKAIDALRKYVTDRGGYVHSYSSSEITLRIPASEEGNLRPVLLRIGYISDENIVKQEISQALTDLNTSLKVKNDHLAKLYGIFSGSGIAETLEVEKEIARVVMEIENIKGRINWYRDRSSLSGVTVRFYKSGERGKPAGRAENIVEWIRMLGVENLMRAY
ncbi:MAG TPA: DUF4349 domain-containing protein [Spirochaetes bacterium]|nr:DUF4349 domain-containing protein [Spirochaetota bacterium]